MEKVRGLGRKLQLKQTGGSCEKLSADVTPLQMSRVGLVFGVFVIISLSWDNIVFTGNSASSVSDVGNFQEAEQNVKRTKEGGALLCFKICFLLLVLCICCLIS